MKNQFFTRTTPDTITKNLTNLRQLIFQVTNKCNLSCTYCGYGKMYAGEIIEPDKSLKYDDAKAVIDFLIGHWQNGRDISRDIYINFYGGEPLKNITVIKKIIKYLDSVKIEGCAFRYSMTTNGLLLERHVEYLVENDVKLYISLDGDKYANSYRVTDRGHSSFDIVFSNIEIIRKNHAEYFERNVEFLSVLHNRNNVEDISLFFKNHFGKGFIVSELNTSDIEEDSKEDFEAMFRSQEESFDAVTSHEAMGNYVFMTNPRVFKLWDYIKTYSGTVFKDYNELIYGYQNKNITGTCTPFKSKLFVTADGKIITCEKIPSRFVYGTVKDGLVKLDTTHIASLYSIYMEKARGLCEKCYMLRSCKTCVYEKINMQGEFICPNFKSQKQFEDYKKENLDYLAGNPELYRRYFTELKF